MIFTRGKTSRAATVPMTSLMDVIFLLLCFFVTSSVFSQWETEIQISLPTAKSATVPGRLPGQVILNVSEEGKVSVNGWLEDLGVSIEELVDGFLPHGLSQVICTDITKDGMLEGPSFGLYTDLQSRYEGVDFTVSGGISSMADIEKLNELQLRKVIVGKAIYENRITLKDIERWLLNA
jgi:phosphoribosylformimino-5-aminoimidazole carboxamide ribonucleotide (ProFAR) isomerase